MVTSQEVIERSIYDALLQTALALEITLDPEDYLPPNTTNATKYKLDVSNLEKYVAIYGVGNNQARGEKVCPRITIESQGFYPGDIGLPKRVIENQVGIGFSASEEPHETLNQYIDIRLVANTQSDMRMLHQVMFASIPQRGYIKPWPSKKFLPSGNIFIELQNFYNPSDLTVGILEKVYQFAILDCLIEEKTLQLDIVPMKEIALILEGYTPDPLIKITT